MDEYNTNPIGEETDGGELENEDQQTETLNEGDDDTSGEGEHQDDAGDAARQEAERTRKFNSAMKAARQSGEKAGEERAARAHSKRIADMRLPNPEKPGTFFESLEEMEAYSASYRRAQAEERAKREKRPVEEIIDEDANREYLRKKREEEEAAKKSKEKPGGQEFVAHDVEAFREKYPDVDVLKLINNQHFVRFAGSRLGKEPLAELYGDYTELTSNSEKAGAVKAGDKRERSTGGNSGKAGSVLTAAQKAELKRWNDNNPDMRMTEKEFLERE